MSMVAVKSKNDNRDNNQNTYQNAPIHRSLFLSRIVFLRAYDFIEALTRPRVVFFRNFSRKFIHCLVLTWCNV